MDTFKARLFSSFKALAAVWIMAGILFVSIVKGPSTISAWLFWGTGVFVVGWILVGLPIIAFGDRIRHVPYLILTFVGGLGGALLMLLPNLVVRIVSPHVSYAPFSIRDFAWPGMAFGIAAPTTALYRFFLDKASSHRTTRGTSRGKIY